MQLWIKINLYLIYIYSLIRTIGWNKCRDLLTSLSRIWLILKLVLCRDDGWTRTNFKESQPTSTYIVAFIVSDFVNTADPETNFKIYTQPARANDTAYAMKYAQTALKHMETYVDRQFQYPKLDMIAIDDFLMGAMENWGLITYLWVIRLKCVIDKDLSN